MLARPSSRRTCQQAWSRAQAHFLTCRDALRDVGPLAMSVDGADVPTAGLEATADDDGALLALLRRSGWAPGLNEVEADIDFS